MKKISIITLILMTLFLTGFCFFCSAQTKELRPSNKILRGATGTMDSTMYSIRLRGGGNNKEPMPTGTLYRNKPKKHYK